MVADSEDAEPAPTRGGVLERVILAVALWLIGVCLLASALGGLGWWQPLIALPLVGFVAAASAWTASPRVLGRLPGRGVGRLPALALVVIGLGFSVWAGTTHAEQYLPRRDSASNLQAAISLARTGERIISVDPAPFGGPEVLALPGLTFASPAFYATGTTQRPTIQPQFVIGPAATYSLGVWLDDALRPARGASTASSSALSAASTAQAPLTPQTPLVLVLPSLFGGLGIVVIGLLTGRVIGGWAAPLAAGLTAISFPILHVSRSTYSEPLSLLTLGAGLLALLLAIEAEQECAATERSPGPRSALLANRWALLAGLLIGGTVFLRIDALRETILLIPVAVLGLWQGARWPRPLLVGAATSTALGLSSALLLANRYLGSISRSLVPLLALGVAAGAGAWLALRLQRRGVSRPARSADRWPTMLPRVIAGITAGLLVLLASRPLWLVVRQDPNDPGSRYVAGMQAREGLPVDGGRTYAEQTITWLSWWLGPATLLLAATALVALVWAASRRWVAGQRLTAWTAPLLVASGSTLATLWRPGITPDHPWAERRLVIAIPFAIVLAVAALASVARLRVPAGAPGARDGRERARRGRGHPTPERVVPVPVGARIARTGPALAGLAALVVVLPTALATGPLVTARVEDGELAAIQRVCQSLTPQDVVLAVDARAANEWPQVVRGQCGNPSIATTAALRRDPAAMAATIDRVRASVVAGGHRLVLLSADDTPSPSIHRLGGWSAVVDVTVLESQHVLEQRPDRLDPLRLVVRLARP